MASAVSKPDESAGTAEEDPLPAVFTGERNNLVRHEIIADDGHPLRLYSRDGEDTADQQKRRKESPLGTILLLHGRTWSSQPVYDLRTSDTDERRQSTLQTLNSLGFAAYALDFRGFGETARDATGYTTYVLIVTVSPALPG